MTTTRKTWIWIVAGVLLTIVVCLITLAGAGAYFVSQHIQSRRLSNTDALRAFDDVRRRFGDAPALYEADEQMGPRPRRPLADLPDGSVKPTRLCVLGWNPDEGRLVRIVLPLWLWRVGHHKMVVATDDSLDLNRLNLDVDDLERIGPALVADVTNHEGSRVLLWTE